MRGDARDHVLVTGATGTTGSRVARMLVERGHAVTLATRTPGPRTGARDVRFDWYDTDTHDPALHGADRAYLVPPVGDPHPVDVMLPFLERARSAGVRRVVLLSSSAIPAGGPGVGQVHELLADGLFGEWTVLRPSWFMQNFTGRHTHADSLRTDGVVSSATGGGRVGFVDAEDIAAVAVQSLTTPGAPGAELLITGPEVLSYEEIAAVLREVTGRPAVHRRLTYEQMRDRLAADGIPHEFAAMLARMDLAIAEGAEDRVTDTVQRMTGRPPITFRAHAEAAMRRGRDAP
ncbi:NAD(P)H-binding protein [Streptomyces sp. NBC_01341]|uniref:NAD(P)H-binding protein n=1 Tax=Streptomyces sp. NBC_01341 TaxID=2903831 RepID=UPI002E120525|nr:NAD(P)H-binding protein [Streptomyces sp. NBC_01341]